MSFNTDSDCQRAIIRRVLWCADWAAPLIAEIRATDGQALRSDLADPTELSLAALNARWEGIEASAVATEEAASAEVSRLNSGDMIHLSESTLASALEFAHGDIDAAERAVHAAQVRRRFAGIVLRTIIKAAVQFVRLRSWAKPEKVAASRALIDAELDELLDGQPDVDM